MKNRALVVVALAALVLSTGVVYAQEQAPWLHIRVTEAGEDGAKVSVNLPISLVQVFADIAEKEIEKELSGQGSHIDLDIDRHDIEIADIRRAWTELSNAGDAEFVEVEEGDEYVKISRTGNTILIEFDDTDGDESGRVEVPVSVVDALLAGEGERLNVRAAIDEMIASSSGEIVFVEDGDTTVRIWIE
jgi:hypothetical protein